MQDAFPKTRKILNDPLYGFISIDRPIVFAIVDHPYFQRLRRIKQLGLSHLVYPGALHTRFHHALGAMHLMTLAIQCLRDKGAAISPQEEEGAILAILLHDIGHGPYSHALERSFVKEIGHEDLSLLFMHRLNEEFNGALTTAINIFTGSHPKKFLHQLVSSQLDVDRLDYLKRDSFYSGVSEGTVGNDRIIKMLVVDNNELAVEEKGIYSIESFLVARRLMYWQVYLHKTVLAAEFMLLNIVKRAQMLVSKGEELFATPGLATFLSGKPDMAAFEKDPTLLDTFASLDDYDLMAGIKVWTGHGDKVLADLSRRLVDRRLFKIRLQDTPFSDDQVAEAKAVVRAKMNLSDEDIEYYIIHDSTFNNAYKIGSDRIMMRYKNGSKLDIAEASDNLNLSALAKPIIKYFICAPTWR